MSAKEIPHPSPFWARVEERERKDNMQWWMKEEKKGDVESLVHCGRPIFYLDKLLSC